MYDACVHSQWAVKKAASNTTRFKTWLPNTESSHARRKSSHSHRLVMSHRLCQHVVHIFLQVINREVLVWHEIQLLLQLVDVVLAGHLRGLDDLNDVRLGDGGVGCFSCRWVGRLMPIQDLLEVSHGIVDCCDRCVQLARKLTRRRQAAPGLVQPCIPRHLTIGRLQACLP